MLDLRFAPDLEPDHPTAQQLLQYLDEGSLFKMLRGYGGMKHRSKYAATAIVEGRYMFSIYKDVKVNVIL